MDAGGEEGLQGCPMLGDETFVRCGNNAVWSRAGGEGGILYGLAEIVKRLD